MIPKDIPTQRQAALERDRLLGLRLEELLPDLMRRHGFDAWIVAGREYAEDPVLRTLLPATWLSARRRTVLLFLDRGPELGIERLAVARYGIGDLFRGAWDPAEQPDPWKRVADLLAESGARRIGINRSRTFAHADGLTSSEHAALLAALGPPFGERLVDAEALCVGWLETRHPEEVLRHGELVRLTHAVIRAGLDTVIPGRTSSEELVWWYRETLARAGLATWFQPLCSVQRADEPDGDGSFAEDPAGRCIEAGDLVHVDVGIALHGLHSDVQHHAYVLRPGESAAPAGLLAGFADMNLAQDLLLAEFAVGRSGNEALARTRAAMARRGIEGRIYTHPLGLHGHAAGATIGLWDNQNGVPGSGDWPIGANTAWSIELNVERAVPEWGGRRVLFMGEENAFYDGRRVEWLDGRQSSPTLIAGAGGLAPESADS